jgi:hypothetical protein
VDGVGAIKLPLAADGNDDAHAKSLISACKQAPFGQGERVVVNKDVRDTWQVDAAQVKSLQSVYYGRLINGFYLGSFYKPSMGSIH